jgi:prolipoprotein diacylglyceryltransferase
MSHPSRDCPTRSGFLFYTVGMEGALDPEHRPDHLVHVATYHPAFLYEGLWNLALAGLLIVWDRRNPRQRPGRLFALYVAGHAHGRLWVEALPFDPATRLLGVGVNIWTSLAAFTGAAGWLLVTRHDRAAASTPDAPCSPPEPEG